MCLWVHLVRWNMALADMGRLIKIFAGAVILAVGMLSAADAATVSLKRGLNLDIWDTWPGEDQWDERAALLPFPEWQRKLDTGDLAALKAGGFDFVRIPVDPAPFLSPKTKLFRDSLYTSVLEAVRKATDAGLKVVVDLHAIPAGERSSGSDKFAEDEALFDQYIELVRRMARMLGRENTDVVALELMNEPLAGCDDNAERWADMQKRLFAAARASATRLTLVLTGGCWSGAEALAEIDPNSIPDDNIIWTFHSYAPFLLTHQGAGWTGEFIRYVTGIPYPPYRSNARERDAALERIRERIRAEVSFARRSGMLSYLDELVAEIDTPEELQAMMSEPFRIVAEWADTHAIEREDILLGEFGMIRQEYKTPDVMNPRWRAAYISDMIKLAEDHGFSWSMWGYGGAFGVVEEFEGRRAEPDILDVVRNLP